MMFELLMAYETAKSEKNKFVRWFLLKYTRHKLKHMFFDNYDIIKNMQIDNGLFNEIIQFFNTTKHEVSYNNYTPRIIEASMKTSTLYIDFMGYKVDIQIIDKYCDIRVKDNTRDILYHRDLQFLNLSLFREIIILTIYNYCVLYILGPKSNYLRDYKEWKELYDQFKKL